jgi:hypothetical protein
MKRVIHMASAKSVKNTGRFLFLIIFSILTLNLSGQNIQTVLGEKWTSGVWVTDYKATYSYDVNSHLTKILTQSWNGSSWENASQINNTINPDGTTSQMVMQAWMGGVWVDFSRLTYTYNTSKQVLTEVFEMLMVFPSTTKQTNTYSGGFLTSTLSQNWNGVSWDDKTKSTFTNNSDGNPTLEIVQSWDGIQWNNTQRVTSTYTASKKINTEVEDDWTAGNWVPHFKESNLYDGNDYLINNQSQTWDVISSTWKNNIQSIYTNNSNGTWNIITNQKWSGSVWTNVDRETYGYSSPTGINDLRTEVNFTLYPNPAHNAITVKADISITGTVYSITDQTGRMVLKGRLSDETTTIDITSLTNGIYFLKIGEKSQHTFKVIKQDSK